MGPVQCTSTRNMNITVEMIEKRLLNNNSPLEMKIHDEYYYLKKLIQESTTQADLDKKDTASVKRGKLIIEYVPPKKRLGRFLKWSQMIYRSYSKQVKSDDKISSHEAKLKGQYLKNLDINPPIKKGSTDPSVDFPQNISNIPNDNDEKPHSNSSSVYMDNNYHSVASNISFNTKTLTNFYEENLTIYFQLHKEHFLQRVSKGPPDSLRWTSWLIAARIPEQRNEEVFLSHLNEQVGEEVDQQIRKDLNRTLLDCGMSTDEENSKSPVPGSLYKVLKAFSSQDKDVSYCQGMNFISGFLLIISDFNEIDTFYMLIGLFSQTYSTDFGIRGFFSEKFPLLNAYLYIFNYFFEKRMPELKSHFEQLDIPKEVWIGKWIQTLYTICLPLNVAIRVWDCLFSYGLDFIIPFSISLVEAFEKDLLKLEDSFDVIDYFKEVMSPVGGKRNPTLGSHGKTNKNEYEGSELVNIEMIIDHAKKLYKSMNKSAIRAIKKEFESKFNIELENLSKKYDMTIYSKPSSENNSQQLNKSSNPLYSEDSHLTEKRTMILPANLLIESEGSKKSSTGFASSRTPKSSQTIPVVTFKDITNLNEINDIHAMVSPISNGCGISKNKNINFHANPNNTNVTINIIPSEPDDDCFECDEFEGINSSHMNTNKMTSHVLRTSVSLVDRK